MEQVLEISERGQITIPKKIRSQFKGQFVTIKIIDNQIILTPVQTVDKFLDELDEVHQDWKKNGGISLSEIKKKYEL
jgi:bifunctional DNA-binding transcriptional regulator/antitoxin component of YhaV-PrlF toxin-antitoxin module